MRKFALIVCILLLLLSLQGCINSSGAEIKSDKYGAWDKETAHLLDTEFMGTLPSAELVESFGSNYYYNFSQALLGDINFVVSIDLQMPDENCLAVQLSELEEKSQYFFSMDGKLHYIIQGSAANAADYMDEEIRDGMFYNFEFVAVNQETATIQYTSARVWDYYRDEVLIAALRPLLEESI